MLCHTHCSCLTNAADQRHERTLRGRAKVSVNTVAIDPMRPHLFATGSSDPLGMLSHGQTHNPWPVYQGIVKGKAAIGYGLLC